MGSLSTRFELSASGRSRVGIFHRSYSFRPHFDTFTLHSTQAAVQKRTVAACNICARRVLVALLTGMPPAHPHVVARRVRCRSHMAWNSTHPRQSSSSIGNSASANQTSTARSGLLCHERHLDMQDVCSATTTSGITVPLDMPTTYIAMACVLSTKHRHGCLLPYRRHLTYH